MLPILPNDVKQELNFLPIICDENKHAKNYFHYNGHSLCDMAF
jgi:hypothetical protein